MVGKKPYCSVWYKNNVKPDEGRTIIVTVDRGFSIGVAHFIGDFKDGVFVDSDKEHEFFLEEILAWSYVDLNLTVKL